MRKKFYQTISPEETERWKKQDVKNLHFYRQLLQRIVAGREANMEFFKNQALFTDFVLEPATKNRLLDQMTFFKERLEVINNELNKRAIHSPVLFNKAVINYRPMGKTNYQTISQKETKRWKNLDVKNLHYYQQLFQKMYAGREAELEFFEKQVLIIDFVLEPATKSQILAQMMFFKERLEIINNELNKRAMNQLETSLN